MKRRGLLALALAAGFGLSLLSQGTSVQAASAQDAKAEPPEDAGAFLIAVGERATMELAESGIDEAERERRFRALFKESFDVAAISRFVLGVHWRRATAEQKTAFQKVFEDYVVQRFLPLFGDYSVDNFVVERVRRDPNNPRHFFVVSKIDRPSGPPAKVEWRIKEQDTSYRILDVTGEGVSLAITLRQEYSSVVRKDGIDGLVRRLREKLDEGAFAPR
ncbi:MAG: ABC transporter substrate-binding protein [Kiloniellales bacterium]|nr:ABC transporter substrate-binding protein [Kiloniellales bacterium]